MKITVIGAGNVGATSAQRITDKGLANEVDSVDKGYGKLCFVDVEMRGRQGVRTSDSSTMSTPRASRISSFYEVPDPVFCHYRNGNRLNYLRDDFRICHPGNSTWFSDICGNSLKGHDSNCSCCFCDSGLLRSCHIHDHTPPFLHTCKAPLRACLNIPLSSAGCF